MVRGLSQACALQTAPKLRWLLSGAEAIPPDLLDELFARLPNTQIFFGYGPTEASEHVSCTTFDPRNPPQLPILVGKPIPNTHVYILDQHQELVPIGVPGHLFASGPCLAKGYMKLPEKTAEAFVENTVDPSAGPRYERMYGTGDLCRWSESGHVQILGRIDRQVGSNLRVDHSTQLPDSTDQILPVSPQLHLHLWKAILAPPSNVP